MHCLRRREKVNTRTGQVQVPLSWSGTSPLDSVPRGLGMTFGVNIRKSALAGREL
jgi:hypothetical protein